MSYPPPPPPNPMQPPMGGMPAKPSNYLVWSIITTIFCCLPLGIVAIIQSTKVDSLYSTGQFPAALKASEDAKKWNIWGMASAALVFVGYILLFVVVGIAGSNA